jgi:hypothetical protein
MPKGMQPIFTNTVGATAVSEINFNNIPQNYTDLKIYISARANGADYYNPVFIKVNGQSGIYSDNVAYAQGGTVTPARNSYGASTSVMMGYCSAATATANVFSCLDVYIPGYSGNLFKQIISDGGSDNNSATSYLLSHSSSLCRTNNPIKSLTISSLSSFVQYTTITLYGISR